MGNKREENAFLPELEKLVVNLLIKQSWKDLQKLENLQYCNKLLVVTTKIFNKHFNNRQLVYLAKRIESGQKPITKSGQLSWISLDQISNIKQNNKQTCQGIAKFYIQIAHVYGAIIKTI